MRNQTPLIKPKRLQTGDQIATVSTSWGVAGAPDVRWKYRLAASRLRDLFGLHCVAAPNSMRGEQYLQENPKARAEDLMWAFEHSEIKGVIANIGGNDSIKLLPYINEAVVRRNPKVFVGYSDAMSVHWMCRCAGLSTFYGPNLLTSFGEPQGVHSATAAWFQQALFCAEPIGEIQPTETYCCDPHEYHNPNQVYQYRPCGGFRLLQGHGKGRGRLIGGHTGMMAFAGSPLFAALENAEDALLFVEDKVDCVTPQQFADFFRFLASKGILQRLKGIVIGRFDCYPENALYGDCLQRVCRENGLLSLPLLCGLPFGHTSPLCVMPYGAMAEIDCATATFRILESGVA